MFIKPAIKGAIIRIPERDMRPLEQEGEDVAESQFWFRRLLFGDVVKVETEVVTSIPIEKTTKKNKEN